MRNPSGKNAPELERARQYFENKGVLKISKAKGDEDSLFLAATEAGAEDFDASQEEYIITTDPADLYAVKDALTEQGYDSTSAELVMLPKNQVECDVETAKANIALIEWLEDLEDVDAVYHNMNLPDELLDEE